MLSMRHGTSSQTEKVACVTHVHTRRAVSDEAMAWVNPDLCLWGVIFVYVCHSDTPVIDFLNKA